MTNKDTPFKITWLNDISLVPTQLWELFPNKIEGEWWYQALHEAKLSDQFQFFYGVVSSQEKNIALVPAFLMDVPIQLVLPPIISNIFRFFGSFFPKLNYQRTFFIGSPCSDEGYIAIADSIDQSLFFRFLSQEMIRQAVILNAPMRVWKDFPSKAPILQALQGERWFYLSSFPGTLLHLSGENIQDYLADLKGTHRHNLKKKFQQAIKTKVEIVSQPSTEDLEILFSLFWQSYEKGKTKFERLNQDFFAVLSQNDEVKYIVLREETSNRIIAFMQCFLLGDHMINKFIGIEHNCPKTWLVYFALWREFINWCYQLRIKTVQSGQTAYFAKLLCGHKLYPLNNYCQHQNSLVHWVYKKISRCINWGTLDEDLKNYLRAYPEKRNEMTNEHP